MSLARSRTAAAGCGGARTTSTIVEDVIVHDLTTLIQKSGEKILKEQTKLVLTLTVLNCLNRKLNRSANQLPRRQLDTAAAATGTGTTSRSASVSSIDDIVLLSPVVGTSKDICWLGLECRNAEDELALVEEFFQRLTAVKVTQGFGTVQGSVDFSHFASLRVLELKRVPVHLIVGLQSLRPRLKLISCSHCLQNLDDLFSSCGGDRCSPFSWPELLAATLTYNTINTIGSSLKFLPSLVSLDLSHNQITDAHGLEFLTELQFLNLGYNKLQHLPLLGSRARLRLKVLSVRNNFLESLEGVESFINLQQADLAYNCLLDHCILAPFLCLPHIVLIRLEGNPISFHRHHRLLTAEHLHKASIVTNCTIDGRHLTNAECVAYLIGTNKKMKVLNKRGSSCRTWKHSSFVSSEIYVDNPSINNAPAATEAHVNRNFGRRSEDKESAANRPSTSTIMADDASTESSSSYFDDNARKFRRRAKKNHPLVREVSIAEDSSAAGSIRRGSTVAAAANADIERDVDGAAAKPIDKSSNAASSAAADVAAAKETMERFRQRHGNEWLIVGSKLNILTPVTTVENDSTTNVADRSEKRCRQSQISDDVIVLDRESEHPTSGVNAPRGLEYDAITDANRSPNSDHGWHDENQDGTGAAVQCAPPWKRQVFDHDDDDESAEEDAADDAVLPPFIVQMEKPGGDSSTTVLVVVSDRDLREKDAFTGRTTERLDLRSICSVESLSPSACDKFGGGGEHCDLPRVKIGFSYVRKDRRERVYTMEDAESHQQFVALLQPLVDARTLEEITSGALQCLKCCSQFSKEVANRVIRKSLKPLPNDGIPISSSFDMSKGYLSEASSCPNCASEMVVPVHERSAPPPPPSWSTERDVSTTRLSDSRVEHGVVEKRNVWDSAILTKSLVRSQSGDVRQHRTRRSSNVVQVEVEIHSYSHHHHHHHHHHQQSDEDQSSGLGRMSSSLPHASLRRSGSDITILSNPSQSSITVVPNPDSSNARQPDCVSLDAISERNSDGPKSPRLVHELDLAFGGSSSCSLTSSACTALEKSIYDGNMAATPDSFLSALSAAVASESGYANKTCKIDVAVAATADNVDGNKSKSPSIAGCSRTSNFSDELKGDFSKHVERHLPERSDVPMMAAAAAQEKDGEPVRSSSPNANDPDSNSRSAIKLATWSCRGARIEYSFANFGDVDHRLRLYLDMQVLSDTEELVAVLRAGIVPYFKDGEFPGILAISDTMVHILRIVGEETDQPHDWLQKYESKPLATLLYLNIRLGNQAFQLEFGPRMLASCYTFLLRDADHCNNFVAHFLDKQRNRLGLAESDDAFQCGLDGEETLQIIREHLLPWNPKDDEIASTTNRDGGGHAAAEDVAIILYLMCYKKQPGCSGSFEPVSLAMTAEDIYVFGEDLHWPVPHLILPQNDVLCRPQLMPIDRRAIQDLTSLEQPDFQSLELILTFLDDDTGEEISLHLAAETWQSVQSIVNALRDPWEKLFGVELQINVNK